MPAEHPVLQPRQNLIVTPHIAWSSLQARQRLVDQLCANLQAWFDGNPQNQIGLAEPNSTNSRAKTTGSH